jgi:transposase
MRNSTVSVRAARRAWAEDFENERIVSLMADHKHAFAHFGGRCAELLYDRMRTVALSTVGDFPALE